MSLAEVGKIVMVCACGLCLLFSAVSAFLFGVHLLKDRKERFTGFGFIVIGLLVFSIVVGLTLIAAEKGL